MGADAQFAQLVEHLRAGGVRLQDSSFELPHLLHRLAVHGVGFGLRTGQQRGLLGFDLLELTAPLPRFALGQCSSRASLFRIVFQRFAFALQILEQLFHGCALRPQDRRCPLEDRARESQALRDCQRVRASGLSDVQFVRRAQIRDAEAHRGVLNVSAFKGEDFQRREVTRDDPACALEEQLLEDRLRQRRAFARVCAAAQLVDQHQRARAGFLEDVGKVAQVRGVSR